MTDTALPSNSGIELNTAEWLFFEIEAPRVPFPAYMREMCPLAPAQCLHAIHHTKAHGGWIELYLTDDRRNHGGATPYVGLHFLDGAYSGHGLGSSETAELEKAIADLRGQDVANTNTYHRLHGLLKHYTRRRIATLHRQDGVSGTTIIPDYWGKPVKFHWTEGYSDVVIDYPPTGLEPGRLDRVPYQSTGDDQRLGVLNAVSEYGADDDRAMTGHEQSLWTKARS